MKAAVPVGNLGQRIPTRVAVPALVLGMLLLWAYGSVLTEFVQRWRLDPQSSHGFLIPILALFLLWQRRERIPSAWPARFNGWGLVILIGSAVRRLAGVHFSLNSCDNYSLITSVAGLVMLLGGWAAWRWAWPAVAYLVFMVPLPFQVETALSGPLQRLAALASAYTLQMLGYPAVAEGNVILMENTRVGVSEACNGLGMLLAFFAISTAVALVCDRPLTDRVILFLDAVPIGVLMNLIRVTVTAIAHQTLGPEAGNRLFHDNAGWMMMPFAVLTMFLELWLLRRLLVPAPAAAAPLPRPSSV